jgi:hypothetical protein
MILLAPAETQCHVLLARRSAGTDRRVSYRFTGFIRDGRRLHRHMTSPAPLLRFWTTGLICERASTALERRHSPAATDCPKLSVLLQEILPSDPVMFSHRSRGPNDELRGANRTRESRWTTPTRLRHPQETICINDCRDDQRMEPARERFPVHAPSLLRRRQGPNMRVSLASV